MLIFISPHGKWMMENCIELACDGTFSSSPAPFAQVFFLMARLRDKPNTVPVGFALLPDKLMSTYTLMMTTVKKVVDFEPGVMERVTVDFERGLWNAMETTLPWAKVGS
jgi:hypothetical protein